MISDYDERHYLVRLREMIREMYKSGPIWEGARIMMADVPLDPKAARRVLPLGMRPSAPAVGTLFIADYPKTSFEVAYKEAALLIHVKTPLGRGVHCAWMVVDDETALIYGREGLGYPKKMARFQFEEDSGGVRGSITRRGVKVLSMEGAMGRVQDHPEPVIARKTFNVGGPGQLLSINPIWMFKPMEVIHQSHELDAIVALEDSEYDPIARLASGPAYNGRFAVLDIPGSRYMLPVGLAGWRFFANTACMRFK